MRAAIYTRISRDREGAGLGVERQEADCRELAERLGWEVVAVYSDNDLSAYSGKARPGYRTLLDDLRTGKVNAVIAWHSDRLHRKVTELEEFVSICEQGNVAVQTVRSGTVDLTNASGRMVARMLGAASQHEIDHSRERMQRAKAQAAQDGRWRGGRRPFGYEADGHTPVPTEAAALLGAAKAVLAGRSLSGIARELAAEGVRTAEGNPMDPVALRRILLRPRNAGLIEHKGTVAGSARWPAIIPEDIWRGVLAVLSDSSRTTTTGPERRWLGSGLYRCGVCGKALKVHNSGGDRVYRCRVNAHVTRSQEPVDEYVRATVAAYLDRDAARLAQIATDGVGDELRSRAEALRARLAAFEADYAAGLITGRQLADATGKVGRDLDEINRQVAARSRGSALAEAALSSRPGAWFRVASLDRQRAILAALVTVTIHPGRRGRPKGWQPGEPYTDLASVQITEAR
jgi:site-specific DNA recombinase